MKIAIHQPNFLPWIGYFNKINQVNKFIFLDDVQFERGKTYTSRTKILVQGKEFWLTVPVTNKSELLDIKDMQVESSFFWKKTHLKTLFLSYKKAPYFEEVFPIIETIYSQKSIYLIDYNIPLIEKICQYLAINVKFIKSSEIENIGKNAVGMNKILNILLSTNAEEYISGNGSGSKRYIDEKLLNKNNISLKWQNFIIKEYNQCNKNDADFTPALSIIDLLFNHGKKSINFIN